MRRMSGFSLMEMMIILLMITIIAAASAPMINQKNNGNRDFWRRVEPSNDESAIYYKDKGPVVIGTPRIPAGSFFSAGKLFIKQIYDDAPQVKFFQSTDEDTLAPVGSIQTGYESIKISTLSGESPFVVDVNESRIYINNNNNVNPDSGIFIGQNINIVDGDSTDINIGNQITIDGNKITLGNDDSIVYIPGKLVVGNTPYLGIDGGQTWMQLEGGKGLVTAVEDGTTGCYYLKLDGSSHGLALSKNSESDSSGEGSETSDRRLKNVGKEFTGSLDEIKKLEVFNYTFKNDKNKTPHVGVMAQDLQKIFPDAVIKGEDGFFRIRLKDMFYSLVNAVKEFDLKIAKLAEQISANAADLVCIKNPLDSNNDKLKDLESRLDELEKE